MNMLAPKPRTNLPVASNFWIGLQPSEVHYVSSSAREEHNETPYANGIDGWPRRWLARGLLAPFVGRMAASAGALGLSVTAALSSVISSMVAVPPSTSEKPEPPVRKRCDELRPAVAVDRTNFSSCLLES
jgi:hypothetical protein